MGPVNNERQFKVVQEFTREAKRQVLSCDAADNGKRLSIRGRVTFCLRHSRSTPIQTASGAMEQFGPILPIIPFDTDDEALAYANDCELGLSSSVWSADVERAVAGASY